MALDAIPLSHRMISCAASPASSTSPARQQLPASYPARFETQASGPEAMQLPGLEVENINCLEKQLAADLPLIAPTALRPLMSLRPSPFHLATAQGPPPGPQLSYPHSWAQSGPPSPGPYFPGPKSLGPPNPAPPSSGLPSPSPEFLVRGKKKFRVNFGLQKRGTTLYCFGVSLHF